MARLIIASQPRATQDEISSLNSLDNESYLDSYSSCLSYVDAIVNSHSKYWKLIDAYQEHISGKKPVPQEELNKSGAAWSSNFNRGKARAKIEQGTADNINKVFNALNLCYPIFRPFRNEDAKDKTLSFLQSPEQRASVASIIAACFIRTLENENDRFVQFMNEAEYPSYAFGFSSAIWSDIDWIPEIIHPRRIGFEPESKPDNIPGWCIFDTIKAKDLYRYWKRAKTQQLKFESDPDGRYAKFSKSSNWSVDGLQEVLLRAFKGDINAKETGQRKELTWKDIMDSYQNKRSWTIANTGNVKIAKIFVKELDGTLSEIYIPYDNDWSDKQSNQDPTAASSTDMIIFRKTHSKYIQRHKIALLRDSGFAENGYISEFRGLAKYAVEDSILHNRQFNMLNDKATITGMPYFEAPSTPNADKFKLDVRRGFVLVQSGFNISDKQPTFDMSGHIGMMNFTEGQYLRDTSQFDPRINGRLSNRPGKSEVQSVVAELNKSQQSKNSIKLKDYGSLFFNMIKKLSSIDPKDSDLAYSSREFFFGYAQQMLGTDESETKKILDCVVALYLEAAITDLEALGAALQLAETPFGRNRIKRMMMFAQGFTIEEVNNAIPLATDTQRSMSAERVAKIENDMFFTTNEVQFDPTDDHIVHLQEHIKKIQSMFSGVQQQAIDPVTAFKYLINLIPHCGQHLDELSRNPLFKSVHDDFQGILEDIMSNMKQLKALASQQIQDQQAQAQAEQEARGNLDPKTAADIQRKNAQAVAKEQRTQFLTASRTEQTNKKIELDAANQRKKIELKAENDKYKNELQARIQVLQNSLNNLNNVDTEEETTVEA